MSDIFDSVRQKVAEAFTKLAGDRARRLDGSVPAEPATSVIASALANEYGPKAKAIAFHMADWNSDAAFVVAVHLFPERFTAEEIAAGVRMFLIHAPNHIRAACVLTGNRDWLNFLTEEESSPGQIGPGPPAE